MRALRWTACLLLLAAVPAVIGEDKKPAPARPLCEAEGKAGRPDEEGFVSLFDGKTLEGWQGDVKGYKVEDGTIVCRGGRNMFTSREYRDFVLRLEFKVPPAGNNGVGIRAPLEGETHYQGMEIQILDDDAPKYKTLHDYQYCCSIYGVVPAKRGHLKPQGEWNEQEITARSSHITVKLNGVVVVDADIAKFAEGAETPDKKAHPGLKRASGYIGFLGHGDPVAFRNIRIKELK
jgi:hypothetical protein